MCWQHILIFEALIHIPSAGTDKSSSPTQLRFKLCIMSALRNTACFRAVGLVLLVFCVCTDRVAAFAIRNNASLPSASDYASLARPASQATSPTIQATTMPHVKRAVSVPAIVHTLVDSAAPAVITPHIDENDKRWIEVCDGCRGSTGVTSF